MPLDPQAKLPPSKSGVAVIVTGSASQIVALLSVTTGIGLTVTCAVAAGLVQLFKV